MTPEDVRGWIALARDVLILLVGVGLLVGGALWASRTVVVVGAVLVVVASGLAVHVELRRRNGGGGDD